MGTTPKTARDPWLLGFLGDGAGSPWGEGTWLASREAAGDPPWLDGNFVRPLIGGFEYARAVRERLERAIEAAQGSALRPGERGHVYLAGWRLDPLRDLSESNPWGTGPWRMPADGERVRDQTVLGLLLRAMQAGLCVRLLLWQPFAIDNLQGFRSHLKSHAWLARVIGREARRLAPSAGSGAPPLGIVALDMRLPLRVACHHQKIVVIRGPAPTEPVAFVGGIDLAFTRRDAPDATHPYDPERPQFLAGDWQSGDRPWAVEGVPPSGRRRGVVWPAGDGAAEGPEYDGLAEMGRPPTHQNPDLSERSAAGRQTLYGEPPQFWHDQHLELRGPVVRAVESTFGERWREDAGRWRAIGMFRNSFWSVDQVLASSPAALDPSGEGLVPLPPPEPVAVAGPHRTQLWRTVPLRHRRRGPFSGGEFTVLSGVVNALAQARELVLIFDQYFWSRPLARLLNARLREVPSLRAIVVLPPWSDREPSLAATREDYARRLALDDATDGFYRENDPDATNAPQRIAIYDLWHPVERRGIYVHAKAQLYDDELFVCGTANLCRRSFLCDTELAVATHDAAVVRDHRARLWRCLFPSELPEHAYPGDLGAPGSGARFFEAFRRAALAPGAFLTPDPWRSFTPCLPSGAERHQHPLLFPRYMYDHVVDPSSVDLSIESAGCPHTEGPQSRLVAGRLDAIAHLLEGCPALDGRPGAGPGRSGATRHTARRGGGARASAAPLPPRASKR
jgi:phosphatidylserine/phosphatidylglycerophosphate/cardiolipin synthase-like enzyme